MIHLLLFIVLSICAPTAHLCRAFHFPRSHISVSLHLILLQSQSFAKKQSHRYRTQLVTQKCAIEWDNAKLGEKGLTERWQRPKARESESEILCVFGMPRLIAHAQHTSSSDWMAPQTDYLLNGIQRVCRVRNCA